MVGRGGRSRACLLCRQRHLKCDETKPQCLRCKNSRLECRGYPETPPFINEDPTSRLRERIRFEAQRKLKQTDPHLTLSVLGDNVYFAYLKQELRNSSTLLDGRWPGFRALEMPDCLSRRCITSFAASIFGRREGNDRARKEGMRLYVKSLGELNRHLAQPEGSPPGQTVFAIGILTVCECLTATSGTGWIQHMLGLTAYFRLRRFEMFKEPYVIEQFEGDRFSMITAAIAARRSTCLASEEWLTKPWSSAERLKPRTQYLLDHTSRLPDLYLDFVLYLKTMDIGQRDALSLDLEKNMEALLRDLRNWELQWRLEQKPRVEEVPLTEAEKRKYCIATKLVFEDIDNTAFTFMIYNTTLIILLGLWKTLRKAQVALSTTVGNMSEGDVRRLTNPNITDSELSDDNDYTPAPIISSLICQSWRAAFDICRTLPLYQTPSGSWIHAIQLVVAIRMALIVFRQDGDRPQVALLEEITRQIGESQQGWEIGRYTMQEFGYY